MDITQKPLPKDKSKYLKLLSEEVINFHYSTHHLGYIKKFNEINNKLTTSDKTQSNANYSEFGELLRRLSFNHAGIVLHDNYWMVIGGDGNFDPKYSITSKIILDFGSIENWKENFIAVAKASLGWALLIKDKLTGKLINVSVDFHNNGAYWDSKVIIACDMFEHAYYKDYGPDRAKYIAMFIECLDIEAIENIYK